MTMDLYGHLLDANLWEAARKIGGISGAFPAPEAVNDRNAADDQGLGF
jgi:hypothetical protein